MAAEYKVLDKPTIDIATMMTPTASFCFLGGELWVVFFFLISFLEGHTQKCLGLISVYVLSDNSWWDSGPIWDTWSSVCKASALNYLCTIASAPPPPKVVFFRGK